METRDSDAAKGPLHLVTEISKEISLSEEEERGFAALLKAVGQASSGGTLWPGSKPEARLRVAAVKANGHILQIAAKVGQLRLKSPLDALGVVERYATMPELLEETGPRTASFEERVTREELRQMEGNAQAHRLAGEPVPFDIAERIKDLAHRVATMEA